jgi:hypothetical protein
MNATEKAKAMQGLTEAQLQRVRQIQAQLKALEADLQVLLRESGGEPAGVEPEIQLAGELAIDANALPVWEAVAELGANLSREEWGTLPSDAARNVDHYLYGFPKEGK